MKEISTLAMSFYGGTYLSIPKDARFLAANMEQGIPMLHYERDLDETEMQNWIFEILRDASHLEKDHEYICSFVTKDMVGVSELVHVYKRPQ